MTWRTLRFCAAVGCLALPSANAAADPPALAASGVPPVKEVVLDNGLRVRIEEHRGGGLVSVVLSYRVGHMDHPAGRRGLPHLVEHLAMRASVNVANGANALSEVGGATNAFTSLDATSYVATVPSNHLRRALWVESDRMGFLEAALSKQSLGEEQNILQHEWLSRSGDASGGKLGDFMWNEVFPEGDARREADDVPEEVIAIKLADVRDFVGKHYHPDNATLAIVGDVDAGAALAAVHRYFDDLPRSAEPPPAAPRAQVSFTGRMTLTLVSQNEQPKLNVVYTVPRPASADEQAVARVMAARLERVLTDELVTKRLWASEVHVYVGDLAGTGYLAISVGLRGNVRHAVVESAVDAIIEHLQTGQYDVEDAKRSVAVDRTRMYSMLATRAMALTEANEARSLDVELSAIGRVTFEQARKYAREQLPSSRRLVVREKAATEAQRVGAVYSREGRLFGGETK